MADLLAQLTARLQGAFDTLQPGSDPMVRVSDRADFQADGALALAKRLGRKPRDIASEIVAAADLGGICRGVEIAGPGFINLTLDEGFLARELGAMAGDPGLRLAPAEHPELVVVDYSHPNVAKEMHVGHLRTTIIGDALCRILGRLGHTVIRENHVGDWGTPFGMLIEHLIDLGEDEAAHELSVGDLNGFYQEARRKFDADEGFKARSRQRVVQLQAGDEQTLRMWRVLVEQSTRYFDAVYGKLGVLLKDEDIVGESFYNAMLHDVVAELDRLGLLVESDGARCVFPPGYVNRENEPLPLIVQKGDGGFGYAATDLAAVRDRVDRLGATWLIYVVGAPQSQHLEMVFEVCRMAGWLKPPARAVHVPFGSVLGTDGKVLRTRAGGALKLVDLLDEAVERAAAVIAGRDPEVPPEERDRVARMIGIGAVKYADLSTDRTRDYVFDWDRMLSFDGDTGPYLQYAHARIHSILRKGEIDSASLAGAVPSVAEPAERALALALLGFGTAIRATVDRMSPHRLCSYLYELAQTFTGFYQACPVLKADDEATKRGRLALSWLTARVLEHGLGLLGIEAPEKM